MRHPRGCPSPTPPTDLLQHGVGLEAVQHLPGTQKRKRSNYTIAGSGKSHGILRIECPSELYISVLHCSRYGTAVEFHSFTTSASASAVCRSRKTVHGTSVLRFWETKQNSTPLVANAQNASITSDVVDASYANEPNCVLGA